MLENILQRELTPTEVQALGACLGERLIAEPNDQAPGKLIISVHFEIPYAFPTVMDAPYAALPVKSQHGDIQTDFRRLINEGFIELFDNGEHPQALSLTLLGVLALTKELHLHHPLDEDLLFEACLATTMIPKVDIEIDLDLIIETDLADVAITGSSTIYEPDFPLKRLEAIVDDPELDFEDLPENQLARELLDYARPHFENIDPSEDGLYHRELLTQLLQATILELEEPLHAAILRIEDSNEWEIAWFLTDHGTAHEYAQELLRADRELQDAYARVDEAGPAFLLFETYDHDLDPTIAMSQQPAEPYHIRWAPELDDIRALRELQESLGPDDAEHFIVNEAGLVRLPPHVLNALHAKHADTTPDPTSIYGPTSMHVLPTNHPLVAPLLGMDLTPNVATSPLVLHVTSVAVVFSFQQAERLIVTRPLPIQDLEDWIETIDPHSTYNPEDD